MKVNLLYKDREWNNEGSYVDSVAIVQDLGLETLFLAAARKQELEDDKVVFIHETDVFVKETMKKVMCVPLQSEAEIVFRQEIMQDFFDHPDLLCEWYGISREALVQWEKLGHRAGAKGGSRDTPGALITEIHILQLYVDTLRQMKGLLSKYISGAGIRSLGLRTFYESLLVNFSDELEANVDKVLSDLAFFANDNEHDDSMAGLGQMVLSPKLIINCRLGKGLKFDTFSLEELATQRRRHRGVGSVFSRAQDCISSLTGESFAVKNDIALKCQVGEMEYRVAQYVCYYLGGFRYDFSTFFDQLHLQLAFYRGALNLKQYMERFHIKSCFPKVCENQNLLFRDLKELVMGIEQRINPVGNSCEILDKNLLIVTGANQGGKSTFLRSIGIAQVMLQCGLPVAAEAFESGIFPALFTHFTRREDSEMNSGRLDEELGRISRIIDNLGEHTMLLFNESFATTTEKEGSVIAYDIVKALTEAGVKVLTVTHLLSFAQRVYQESAQGSDTMAKNAGKVEFFSAERMEDGRRTYRMIQHAPELTSFGLDLYEELIQQKLSSKKQKNC